MVPLLPAFAPSMTRSARSVDIRWARRRFRRSFVEQLEDRSLLSSVVVPSVHANTEGGGMNAIPFASTPYRRYQQIYSASEFAAGGVIDKISFRRDVNASPFAATDLNVQISLSHAATTVATASAVFADNIG